MSVPPRLGYAGATLLRAAEERDETTLPRALEQASAAFHLFHEGRILHRGPPERPDTLFTPEEARRFGGDLAQAVLLGWTPSGGAPRLALALEAAPMDVASIDLRAAGVAGSLAADVEGDLAQAQALLNWHRRTRFCGVCGGATRPALAGYRRDCTACEATHFPRTDPVVIMLVHDGAGNAVLGRQPHFAPGMWSCLAGFVEPGETIEDAVRREVAEEVGAPVGAVAYRLSQPWPFPGSLMIGCFAEAPAGPLTVQDSELEAARWFTGGELAAMLAGSHAEALALPPPYAIAHHLVRLFVEESAKGLRSG